VCVVPYLRAAVCDQVFIDPNPPQSGPVHLTAPHCAPIHPNPPQFTQNHLTAPQSTPIHPIHPNPPPSTSIHLNPSHCTPPQSATRSSLSCPPRPLPRPFPSRLPAGAPARLRSDPLAALLSFGSHYRAYSCAIGALPTYTTRTTRTTRTTGIPALSGSGQRGAELGGNGTVLFVQQRVDDLSPRRQVLPCPALRVLHQGRHDSRYVLTCTTHRLAPCFSPSCPCRTHAFPLSFPAPLQHAWPLLGASSCHTSRHRHHIALSSSPPSLPHRPLFLTALSSSLTPPPPPYLAGWRLQAASAAMLL